MAAPGWAGWGREELMITGESLDKGKTLGFALKQHSGGEGFQAPSW